MPFIRAQIPLMMAILALMAACERVEPPQTDRAIAPLNVVDDANLNDIMLTAAAPEEAVAYFRRATDEAPDRIDLQRGLATTLVRAGRAEEALPVWHGLVDQDAAQEEDRLGYAGALIRTGAWQDAAAQLARISPALESYDRFRLEALVADSTEDWDRADGFYRSALGLATQPANILNNWGFSLLTRGDYEGAEDVLLQAISHDPDLFTAKNNLILARAAQGNYRMPLIRMTQIERAQLLHTAGLAAVRRGDIEAAHALLTNAVESHPQHFEPAVSALRALRSDAAVAAEAAG